MKWRVWYAGGRRFEGTTLEDWKALPAEGFLVGIRYGEEYAPGRHYRQKLDQGDWYWYWDRVPTHAAQNSWNSPPANIEPEMLKRGVMVPDDEWDRVIAEAMSMEP